MIKYEQGVSPLKSISSPLKPYLRNRKHKHKSSFSTISWCWADRKTLLDGKFDDESGNVMYAPLQDFMIPATSVWGSFLLCQPFALYSPEIPWYTWSTDVSLLPPHALLSLWVLLQAGTLADCWRHSCKLSLCCEKSRQSEFPEWGACLPCLQRDTC